MVRDDLSFATSPLVAFAGERPLWQGTAFFYLFQKGEVEFLYLVTACHVLTGLAPGAQAQSSADHIVFQFHGSTEDLTDVRPIRFPLYTRQGRPVWLQSEAEPEADLAVLPVPAQMAEGTAFRCLDLTWSRGTPSSVLTPLMPLHAVGFPCGIHDRKHSLPAWQTGVLACEPDADVDGHRKLLAEFSPYPGMAGAPVFAQHYREAPAAEGQSSGGAIARQFLGVYAPLPLPDGRFPDLVDGARPSAGGRGASPWGHVWRAKILEGLLASVDMGCWEREILGDLL